MQSNFHPLREILLSTQLFLDNIYLEKYIEIIVNKTVDKIPFKTTNHHIIPRSICKRLNIDCNSNSYLDNNVITIYHKDHIMSHFYIYMCIIDKYKPLAAYTLM